MSFDRVVELLAGALGKERSEELILSAVRAFGYSEGRLSQDQTLEVLMSLGSHPGIVGIAARFARTRLLSRRKTGSSAPPRDEGLRVGPEHAPESKRRAAGLAPTQVAAVFAPTQIAALLAPTLGTAKSTEIVTAAVTALGLGHGPLDEGQAFAILEFAAKAPGIVGVAARFAKARLILQRGRG